MNAATSPPNTIETEKESPSPRNAPSAQCELSGKRYGGGIWSRTSSHRAGADGACQCPTAVPNERTLALCHPRYEPRSGAAERSGAVAAYDEGDAIESVGDATERIGVVGECGEKACGAGGTEFCE